MVTVKMLKPYYIKSDENFVSIVLAYQYFAVLINDKVYQFIPVDAKEIRINRDTQKVENMEARFAFQKGKDVVYLSMTELISLPDFLVQLHTIVSPYLKEKSESKSNETVENSTNPTIEIDIIINELERRNIIRLIDYALDIRDELLFHSLVNKL